MLKKIIAILLSAIFLVLATSCSKTSQAAPLSSSSAELKPSAKPSEFDDWAIYWYLCGSDLETNHAAGTNDLFEMMDVKLPDNVTVVIQTGGAYDWQNNIIDATKLQRYRFDKEGLRLVDEQPLGSMGESQTLYDFLLFAKENYPAKHVMINIWNHGGGSLAGVAFDEQNNMDSLKLPELYNALSAAYGSDLEEPPVDIVGLDACLMATLDVASTFSGVAKYLVASQEVEPGIGWDYTGILNAIADNPEIEPFELSTVICDTYLQSCEKLDVSDNVTLSVTDLSKVNDLLTAYNFLACELLAGAAGNQKYLVDFAKACSSIESYGPNASDYGFTNMADLGHMASRLEDAAPFYAPTVQSALEACVAYKVNGVYKQESSGLSFYCPYDCDLDNLEEYFALTASEGIEYFYYYLMTGILENKALNYLEAEGFSYLSQQAALKTIYDTGWENRDVYLDEDGYVTLLLDGEAKNILSSVRYRLYCRDPDFGYLQYLGDSNDVLADWENGIFKEQFSGVWGYLDGSLCFMDFMYENDYFKVYSIPIYLNGDGCYLTVYYDCYADEYYLGDVRRELYESGAIEKNARYLEPGDVVEPMLYGLQSNNFWSKLLAEAGDGITVTSQTGFYEAPLGDGSYEMRFIMEDFQGNITYSMPFAIEIHGDEYFVSVVDA